MWFIGVEVEQETSAPPPKKNPGSDPVPDSVNNIADNMARTNKHALRKVAGVYTERTVTLLLKLSVISSVR